MATTMVLRANILVDGFVGKCKLLLGGCAGEVCDDEREKVEVFTVASRDFIGFRHPASSSS